MCTAEATFFYGVFVKLACLCFASDSYKANKKSLFAIDLICSRRRKGRLSIQGSTNSIPSVPEEVWEMVKLKVVDIGMQEAEDGVLEEYFGQRVAGYEIPKSWEDLDLTKHCFDTFLDNSGARDMLNDRESALGVLLTDFGLALPFDCPYSEENYPQDDPSALSAISLPLCKTGSPLAAESFSTLELDPPVEGGTAHGLAQFTEDSLKLPSDATNRIKRFLYFFRLESIKPASITIYRPLILKPQSSLSVNTKEESTSRKATHESKCCSDPETEPHWHLWVSSRWTW